jgi:hypothetical protein
MIETRLWSKINIPLQPALGAFTTVENRSAEPIKQGGDEGKIGTVSLKPKSKARR